MLKILKYPHKKLRQVAKPIKDIDSSIEKIVDQMMTVINANDPEPSGVGLAGPQVGIMKRLFIMQMPNDKIEVVINPEIIKSSKKMLSHLGQKDQFIEGCLSFPGYYGFVDRPAKVKVRYQTIKGLTKQVTLKAPHSSYFQHERDHLDGVVFVDYIKKSGEQMYLVDKKSNRLKPIANPFK